MAHARKLFSFSNVIALVALFVALGGTVYAATSISGSQIKQNSIPGNRLKPGAVAAKQIKSGSITAKQIKSGTITGKQVKSGSLTGTQVVGSSLTGVSASSIGAVQYVNLVVALTKEAPLGNSGIAPCPTGQKVIGGGATVSNEQFDFVNDSGPTPDRNGWYATGFTGNVGTTMTITAICTVVKTPTG